MKIHIYIIMLLCMISCQKNDEKHASDIEKEPMTFDICFISSRENNFDLYRIETSGFNEKRLTDNPEFDWNPSFSVYLNRITYNSVKDKLFIFSSMLVDGSDKDSLSFQNGDSYSISPDGQKILFVETDDGNSEIYIANIDGKSATNLTANNAYDGRPQWSRSGKMISFISERDGDAELFIMDLKGENILQLTHNSDREKYHTWSPNDDKIAFVSYRNGDEELGEIFIYDLQMNQEKQLTNNSNYEAEIQWSPNSSLIAYHGKNTEGKDEIFTIDAETGVVSQVTENDYYDGEPTWIPQN